MRNMLTDGPEYSSLMSSREFRTALSQLPTGVAVLTTRQGLERAGRTDGEFGGDPRS